jgi:hypothetical protein
MELGFSFERRIESHIIAYSASACAHQCRRENLLHAQFGDAYNAYASMHGV